MEQDSTASDDALEISTAEAADEAEDLGDARGDRPEMQSTELPI